MAKSKSSEEIVPVQIVPTFGAAGGDETETELERLRARVAELEAASAKAAEQPPVVAAEQPGRFLVKVTHAPSWVVKAASQYHAIEAYKRATGMVQFGYQPEVKPVADDTPLGEWKG